MPQPHYNVYLSEGLMRRIQALAEATERTPPKQVVHLVRIALRLDAVPQEWQPGEGGALEPTGIPAGTTVTLPRKATFRAPEEVLVAVDNFRADNAIRSFSEALRILLTAGLAEVEREGCQFCKGDTQ